MLSPAPPRLRRIDFDAVVFDVDGTLYDPRPIQRAMALRLLLCPFTGPRDVPFWRVWRIVWTFRRHRETLRKAEPGSCLENRQYDEVAERLSLPAEEVRRVVRHWLLEDPLPVLRRHRPRGLSDCLRRLHESGLRLGLLSDYPARAKAEALGVPLELFQVVRSTTDADIDVFKPHPRPFEVLARELQAENARVLYVGDRFEVDVAGARGADMASVLVTWGRKRPHPEITQIASPSDLAGLLLEG